MTNRPLENQFYFIFIQPRLF